MFRKHFFSKVVKSKIFYGKKDKVLVVACISQQYHLTERWETQDDVMVVVLNNRAIIGLIFLPFDVKKIFDKSNNTKTYPDRGLVTSGF